MPNDSVQKLYDGLECGLCGEPVEPEIWCGNEECALSYGGPETQTEDYK